jgi:hypothetical protein
MSVPISIRRQWLMFVIPTIGCGSAGGGAALATDAGPKCTPTETLLVAATSYLPPADAGPGSVGAPSIAVNGTDLYYAVTLTNLAASPVGASSGFVAHVPIRGGAPRVVAALTGGGASGSQGLALSSTSVVFVEASDLAGDGGGAVVSAPLAGGRPTILATTVGPPVAIVADSRNAYFVDRDGLKGVSLAGGPVFSIAKQTPLTLAVVGPNLVLADFFGGNVYQIPTTGGGLSVLATQQSPLYPTACAPGLCWLNAELQSGEIVRLSDAGAPTILAKSGVLNEPHGLAFDGTSFFVTSGAAIGYLTKVPGAGGAVTQIAMGGGITSVAVDESCVYWSSFAGIFSISK